MTTVWTLFRGVVVGSVFVCALSTLTTEPQSSPRCTYSTAGGNTSLPRQVKESVFADVIGIVYTPVAIPYSSLNSCALLHLFIFFINSVCQMLILSMHVSCNQPEQSQPERRPLQETFHSVFVSRPSLPSTCLPWIGPLSPPAPVVTFLFSSSPDVPCRCTLLVHHARLRRAFHILFFTSLCFSFLIYLGLWHTPLLEKKKKRCFWPTYVHSLHFSRERYFVTPRKDMERLRGWLVRTGY